MNKYIQLIRIKNCVMVSVATIIGGVVVYGLPNIFVDSRVIYLLFAAISTFMFAAAGNVLNDYMDIDIDRINHPERPLPSRALNRSNAKQLVYMFFILGFIPVIFIIHQIIPMLLIYSTSLILMLAYEFRYKNRGFSGNVIIAFLTALLFIYGGISIGGFIIPVILSIPAFFATLSREITKDIEDLEGDFNRITVPKIMGIENSATISSLFMIIAIFFSFLPLIMHLSNDFALTLYTFFIFIGDAVFILSIYNFKFDASFHTSQSYMKLGMLAIFIAYIAISI